MPFLDNEKKEKLNEFTKFVVKELNIKTPPSILIQNGKGKLKTTASYDYTQENKIIRVNGKNRALVDIMRSLSHELSHHKQWEDKKLTDPKKDGEDGSDIENEAHSISGLLIRKFGNKYPIIYDC